MHDQENFWEMLQDMPSNTNVQELLIQLSDFIPDQDGPEQPSERDKDPK